MSNPYQSFFDLLDKTVVALEGADKPDDTQTWDAMTDATDLLKRAGFVLANQLNMQASVYPMLFLEPEPAKGEVTGDDGDDGDVQ